MVVIGMGAGEMMFLLMKGQDEWTWKDDLFTYSGNGYGFSDPDTRAFKSRDLPLG